jgi:uncharacterized membrane protein
VGGGLSVLIDRCNGSDSERKRASFSAVLSVSLISIPTSTFVSQQAIPDVSMAIYFSWPTRPPDMSMESVGVADMAHDFAEIIFCPAFTFHV